MLCLCRAFAAHGRDATLEPYAAWQRPFNNRKVLRNQSVGTLAYQHVLHLGGNMKPQSRSTYAIQLRAAQQRPPGNLASKGRSSRSTVTTHVCNDYAPGPELYAAYPRQPCDWAVLRSSSIVATHTSTVATLRQCCDLAVSSHSITALILHLGTVGRLGNLHRYCATGLRPLRCGRTCVTAVTAHCVIALTAT